jgi:hypothetical protein
MIYPQELSLMLKKPALGIKIYGGLPEGVQPGEDRGIIICKK